MRRSDDNSCHSVRDLMEDFIAEGLSDGQTVQVLAHLRECETCTLTLEFHARLCEWQAPPETAVPGGPATRGGAETEPVNGPTASEFAAMRTEVLRSLENNGLVTDAHAPRGLVAERVAAEGLVAEQLLRPNEQGASPSNLRGRYPSSVPRWQPALAAAATLVIFGLGWWAGRMQPLQAQPSGRSHLADLLLLDQLMPGLSIPGNPDLRPYDLQDVRVRALDDATVAISFDVATHLELERSRDDPLVTEVIAQSILGGSDLGGRLNAISQTALSPADGALPPRISDALVQAMLKDPSVAVRMQAQQRLVESLPNSSIESLPNTLFEDAFLAVLEGEQSVQMRLLAIDALAASGVASERLQSAMAAGRPEPGNALKLHVGNYLRDL